MKTKFTQVLSVAVLLSAAGYAQAGEVSANIAAASNYLFRGLSQTDDAAAVSGGVDYDHGNGFSGGVWLSNIDFGGKESAEVDIYGGFSGTKDAVDYSVGAIYYFYPGAGGDSQGGDLDYAEINASVSYKMITGSIAYNIWGEVDDDANAAFDDGDVYYNLSADLPIDAAPFDVSVFIGRYDFENVDAYTHWGASISKDAGPLGTFSMTYEQTNGDEEDDVATSDSPDFWIGWSKDI